MTRYRYEAVSAAGEILIGEMEAETQIAVVESLQNLGHVPLRADIASGSLWSKLGGLDLRPRKGRGLRNLALLTQQLATLLEAGLSLDRALELAQAAMTTRNERECLGNLLNKVRGGSALAEAMAAEPLSFPKFTIGMVRAGEAGASLDTTLRHLAEFLEKSQAARQQIISALI